MNPNNERITDLPTKQVVIVLDQDILINHPNKTPAGINGLIGGLVGIRFNAAGNISLSLLHDIAPGPVFSVAVGDVYVGRVRQVHTTGTTVAAADMIGLA